MTFVGKLTVIKGEQKGLSYTLRKTQDVSIGRSLDCSIPVPDIKLSRVHCVIRSVNNKLELLDNNSTNGTYVDQKKIELPYELKPNDVIEIGDTQIQFTYETDDDKATEITTINEDSSEYPSQEYPDEA